MFITAVLFNIIWLIVTTAYTDKTYLKIEQRLSKVARANNVSDERLIVRELHTFVHDHGLRRRGTLNINTLNRLNKNVLRDETTTTSTTTTTDRDHGLSLTGPNEKDMNLKIIDLMKQAIYRTQQRVRELNPILEKYNKEAGFKMMFIFNRLRQLIIDMRRIYTIAKKERYYVYALKHSIYYTHMFRKYVDVLYIVEHAQNKHGEYLKQFLGEHGLEVGTATG